MVWVAQFERERDSREQAPSWPRQELEELRQFREQYPACKGSALKRMRADAIRAVEMLGRTEPDDADAQMASSERYDADMRRGASGNRFNTLA